MALNSLVRLAPESLLAEVLRKLSAGAGECWSAAFEPLRYAQRPRELGWIEGRSVAIDYRWAEEKEERFDEIAAKFVRLNDHLLSPTLWPEVPHPVHGDATDAGQLNFRFAALAKA
jgi:hypothetical protein